MSVFPTDEEFSKSRKWSAEELAVLVTIYFQNDFAIGDDGRAECQLMADTLGRSSSAIDRQWRNIDAIVKSKPAFNVGKLVRETVVAYLNNPMGVQAFARVSCTNRNWPLLGLLEGSFDSSSESSGISSQQAATVVTVQDGFAGLLDGLEEKVFSSGSRGFFVQGKIRSAGKRYQSQVSAVLIGSRGDPTIALSCSPQEVRGQLLTELQGLREKTFSSGKQGYYLSTKIAVAAERFQVSIQAIAIGG